MEKVITPGRQVPGRNPVEILLFRAVIVRAVEKRNKADGMPAEGVDVAGRDLALPVVIGDSAPEKSAAIRSPQSLERVGIEAGAADPGKDRVK
jgi:hypothetical protein